MTSCCVSVLPPTRYGLSPLMFVTMAPMRADEVHAGMLVEPSILDGEHGLAHRSGMRSSGTWRRFSRAGVHEGISIGGSTEIDWTGAGADDFQGLHLSAGRRRCGAAFAPGAEKTTEPSARATRRRATIMATAVWPDGELAGALRPRGAAG